jgi:hypothetical protein
MLFFAAIPTLLYVFIAYNFIVLVSHLSLQNPLLQFSMLSGGHLSFNLSDLLLILGILALYIELIKSTRTNTASVLDHVFSMLLFVLFLVEFLLVKTAASSTFFILMLMQMLDVIAGFSISITAARRDMSFDQNH